MRRGKNTHIRPEHRAIPNRHDPAVQDTQVEVRVEPVSQAHVAAVVEREGRLDEDVVADTAEDLLELCLAVGGEGCEGCAGVVVREPVVVFVAPGAGFEAGGFEGGREGVVAGRVGEGMLVLHEWDLAVEVMVLLDG